MQNCSWTAFGQLLNGIGKLPGNDIINHQLSSPNYFQSHRTTFSQTQTGATVPLTFLHFYVVLTACHKPLAGTALWHFKLGHCDPSDIVSKNMYVSMKIDPLKTLSSTASLSYKFPLPLALIWPYNDDIS
jgi:hypothetical protein